MQKNKQNDYQDNLKQNITIYSFLKQLKNRHLLQNEIMDKKIQTNVRHFFQNQIKFQANQRNSQKSILSNIENFNQQNYALRAQNKVLQQTFLQKKLLVKQIKLNYQVEVREKSSIQFYQNKGQQFLFILGGRGYKDFCDFYKINLQDNNIQQLQLKTDGFCQNICIYGHDTYVIKDMMYVVGGVKQKLMKTEFIFSINLNNSEVNKCLVKSILQPQQRYNHASCMLDENYIIVSGGENKNGRIFRDFWIYSIQDSLWFPVNFYFFSNEYFVHGISKHQIVAVKKDEIKFKKKQKVLQEQLIQDLIHKKQNKKINHLRSKKCKSQFKKVDQQLVENFCKRMNYDNQLQKNSLNQNKFLKFIKNSENLQFDKIYQNFLLTFQKYDIYLFGGINKSLDCSSEIYKLKICKDIQDTFYWKQLKINSKLPLCRFGHKLIHNPQFQLIISIGGKQKDGEYIQDINVYDINEKKWGLMKCSDSEIIRTNFDCCISNQNIYIFGGLNNFGYQFSNIDYISFHNQLLIQMEITEKNDENIFIQNKLNLSSQKQNKIAPKNAKTKKINIFKILGTEKDYQKNINFLQKQLEGFIYCNKSAKIIRNKYLNVRQVVLYLEVLCFIFSLLSFSLTYHFDNQNNFQIFFAMTTVTLFKTINVLLNLFSYKIYNKLLISIGEVKYMHSIFDRNQKILLTIKSLLLFIHPQYLLINVQSFLQENYFVDDYYLTFRRDINHYLYIIQYIVSASLIFYIILEKTKFANVQTQRIAKMFGLKNDVKFIFKCLLAQHGPLFVVIQFFFGIFILAVLVAVSEIGFLTTIQNLSQDQLTYLQQNIQIDQLVYYYNSFWYVMITVTTIGYGDMYARANLTKIIIFFCSFYGVVVFPLLVVTITNIFQIPNQEKVSLLVVKMVNQKKELKKIAAKCITIFYKLYVKKNNNSLQQISLQQSLQKSLKQFKKQLKIYKTLQYSDNKAEICRRIFKIQNEFQQLEGLMQKKLAKK